MSQYLKRICLAPPPAQTSGYPFDIPALRNGVEIAVTSPIVILAGENGAGKSTLLSAIAQQSGFNPTGGNQHHHFGDQRPNPLTELLTLHWGNKVRQGFYLRADRMAEFQTYLANIGTSDPSIFESYGGQNLAEQSHGEGIFALYQHHFRRGIFILDEPETALSFDRQLALVSVLRSLARDHEAQFVIATHSPVLMSMPDAQLCVCEPDGVHQRTFTDTEIAQTMQLFFKNPERFHRHL